jgi:hypothetical protein
MPKTAEDICVEILIERRQLQDRLSWRVPCYMLLSTSFILAVALSAFTNVARIIASGLGMILAAVAILSVDRLKNGELFDTSLLNKIVTKLSNDQEIRFSSLKEGQQPVSMSSTGQVAEGKQINVQSVDISSDIPVDWTIGRSVIGDKYKAKRAAFYIDRDDAGIRTAVANYTGNIGWIIIFSVFWMAFFTIFVLGCLQEDDTNKHYL